MSLVSQNKLADASTLFLRERAGVRGKSARNVTAEVRHPLVATKYALPGYVLGFSLVVLLSFQAAHAQPPGHDLLQQHWFSARTAHFEVYSCATTQQVTKLLERLEQFRGAYSLLAGAQAVASPPIVVMAFPDHKSFKPFLPLFDGKPANMSAFFIRGSDENMIALSVADSEPRALDSVFHEYAHLLLRRNDRFWPLWLKEGMAEIYSTLEVTGPQTIRIGVPIEHHIRYLQRTHLMSLREIFAVSRESADYNEGERQGVFYSESWLLVHYLMVGDNGARKTRFGQLTTFLRAGQSPEQAFTNALGISLAATETQLQKYLAREKLDSVTLAVRSDLMPRAGMAFRIVAPVEVCFRLGDLLLRINRPDTAAQYFQEAQKLAPRSPLAAEGMGLLAAQSGKHQEALNFLHESLQRGSPSFLAHYAFAREKFRLLAHNSDEYVKLPEEDAAEIRAELLKTLTLMPDFGPAHNLLGFLEMVQGDNLQLAEKHIQLAIQLEPENSSYQFGLAQVQLRKNDLAAARRTLEGLRTRYVEEQVRTHAEELLREIGRNK